MATVPQTGEAFVHEQIGRLWVRVMTLEWELTQRLAPAPPPPLPESMMEKE